MKILAINSINTTTQFTTPAGVGGTATIVNMFDRDTRTQWQAGNDGDGTSASFNITFDVTQTVSEIIFRNWNARSFDVTRYNAGTLITVTGAEISVTANSLTNYYATLATAAVTTITVQIHTTIVADEAKEIGEMLVTRLLYDFASDRLPAAAEYKPAIAKRQIVHEMSDGGVSVYNVKNKFAAEIEMRFVPTATEQTLRSIYDQQDPFNFVPLDTTTGWDGNMAECNWIGDYEFLEFSDNAPANGYTGMVRLRQTQGGQY